MEKLKKRSNREYGKAEMTMCKINRHYFSGSARKANCLDEPWRLVVEAPEGFTVDGTSPSCPIAAMSNEERKLYAVQFHPEVRHSVYGNELLKNFVFNVCECKGDWSMGNFIEVEMAKIRRTGWR